MDLLLQTPGQWIGAAACAFVVGAAKTGVPGLGFLAVPWMAWLLYPDSRLSVGALLPLLCCADMMAVWLYRRNAAIHHLWHMLPWVVVGMGGGWLILRHLPNASFGPLIGSVVLLMISIHVWRICRKRTEPPGRLAGAGFGIVAGTTTTVANAAGPVMNMYLLALRLPKEEFIAAGAWFFFAINLAKLPIYGCNDMISQASLLMDACLVPAVVAGSLVGRRIVPHIPQRTFEIIVLVLAAIGAARLLVPVG